MPPDSASSRTDLLADVVARREQLVAWKQRAKWAESIGGFASALVAAAVFRVVWTGGIFGRLLGASSWLFTIIVALVALVVARGVIATIASRWLVPARREVVAAESRLFAHDAAFGRNH